MNERPESAEDFAKRWIDYHDESAIFRSHTLFQPILETLGDVRNLKILDAGCGNGSLLQCLENLGATSLMGIDVNPYLIKECGNSLSPVVSLLAHNILQPWPTAPFSFDRIIGSCIAMHFSDSELEVFFRESAAALAPEGRLILATVNLSWAKEMYPLRLQEGGTFIREDVGRLSVAEFYRDADAIARIALKSSLVLELDRTVKIESTVPELPERYSKKVGMALFSILSFSKS